MRQVRIQNKTRSLKTPLVCDYAASFASKLRGLAWQRSLAADRGLILAEGSESRLGTGIHMLGMRFDLTIVWLDSDLRVVDVQIAHKWRSFLLPRKPARYVIECPDSRYEDFSLGDQLVFEDL
jgi:uncharacterized membrane protein (UPF0127 family)